MSREEEEAVHVFSVRLSHKLMCIIPAEAQSERLWQALYAAIRADLERARRGGDL
jgi:hypothetical protein